MKTLYESILDNEDVLIKDIKKHSNNPFRVLKYYYDEIDKTRSTDPQWGPKWRKVVDEELKRMNEQDFFEFFQEFDEYFFIGNSCVLQKNNEVIKIIHFDVLNNIICLS